jgi:hypothetical protein
MGAVLESYSGGKESQERIAFSVNVSDGSELFARIADPSGNGTCTKVDSLPIDVFTSKPNQK